MPERIGRLGATIFRKPTPEEIPDLVAKITRLWGELKTADIELAMELAQKLPDAEIIEGSK